MGDTRLCPDDGGTWASITTPQTVPVIRKAAAAVRAARSGGSEALDRSGDAGRRSAQSIPTSTALAIVTGAKTYPVAICACPGCCTPAVVRAPHHKATLCLSMRAAPSDCRRPRPARRRPAGCRRADMATARRAAALVTAEWTPMPLTPQAEWPALFKKTAVEPVEQPQRAVPAAAPARRRGAGLGAAAARQVVGLLGAADRPRAARAASRNGRVERRGGDRALRRAGAVPRAAGSGAGARRAGVAGPHHRGRLRRRIRWQAARRVRGRGGAAGAAGGRAGPAWRGRARKSSRAATRARPGCIEVESGVDARAAWWRCALPTTTAARRA